MVERNKPSIDVTFDAEAGLLIYTCYGAVTADQYCAAILEQVERHKAPNALWDYLKADLSDMTPDRLMKVAEAVKATMPFRGSDPRTVFVTTEPQEKILAKLYGVISHRLQNDISYKTVNSVSEGIAWLASGAPD